MWSLIVTVIHCAHCNTATTDRGQFYKRYNFSVFLGTTVKKTFVFLFVWVAVFVGFKYAGGSLKCSVPPAYIIHKLQLLGSTAERFYVTKGICKH